MKDEKKVPQILELNDENLEQVNGGVLPSWVMGRCQPQASFNPGWVMGRCQPQVDFSNILFKIKRRK